MPAGKFNDLRDFRFRNFVRKYPAHANAVPVDMEHDLHGFIARLVEEALQNVHHELHRRVVVVQNQHFVEARPLRLRPRLGHDSRAVAGPLTGPAVLFIAHALSAGI